MHTVNEMVERIAERFHPQRIILFGSRARGVGTDDSDIDLLVVMDVAGSRRRAANEVDLALADRTVAVDIVVVTPEEFERQKDERGTVVGEATREGRTVYERAA